MNSPEETTKIQPHTMKILFGGAFPTGLAEMEEIEYFSADADGNITGYITDPHGSDNPVGLGPIFNLRPVQMGGPVRVEFPLNKLSQLVNSMQETINISVPWNKDPVVMGNSAVEGMQARIMYLGQKLNLVIQSKESPDKIDFTFTKK